VIELKIVELPALGILKIHSVISIHLLVTVPNFYTPVFLFSSQFLFNDPNFNTSLPRVGSWVSGF
jgi:hypothetical protein